MANAWVAALAALVCLAACRTAERKPVEVETPVGERHFIVMGDGDGRPMQEARARDGAPGAASGGMRRTN